MGQSLVDVYITEEYRASVKEVLDNALQGREAANFEFPLFTKNKKRVEVLLNGWHLCPLPGLFPYHLHAIVMCRMVSD